MLFRPSLPRNLATVPVSDKPLRQASVNVRGLPQVGRPLTPDDFSICRAERADFGHQVFHSMAGTERLVVVVGESRFLTADQYSLAGTATDYDLERLSGLQSSMTVHRPHVELQILGCRLLNRVDLNLLIKSTCGTMNQ